MPEAKLVLFGKSVKKVNAMLLKLELAGVIKFSPQKSALLPAEGPAVFSSTVAARAAGSAHKQSSPAASLPIFAMLRVI